MKKINLLIISTVAFRKHGISIAIMNNYRLFNSEKIKCTFVTHEDVDASFAEEIEKRGDKIYVLPNRKKRTLAYMIRLRQIAKSIKFEVAHVHGNSATMLFELISLRGLTRIICQAHSTSSEHSRIDSLCRPLFFKMLDRRAACSSKAGDFLFGSQDYTILKNGIESQNFKYSEDIRLSIRNQMNVADEFVLLHVGHFNRQKNQIFVIKIFREYVERNSNSVLWLIGDGYEKDSIKKVVSDWGLDTKVKFVGTVDNVNEFMMGADCFLLPSLYEGFGIVNIEAQATGLPCIISENIPSDVLITDYIFVENLSNLEGWVSRIEKCMDIKVKRTDSFKRIYESVYDISETAKFLCEYYEKIVG